MELIFNHTPSLPSQTISPTDPTMIGRVLQRDVYAPYNLPSHPSSNVDGYAISSSSASGGSKSQGGIYDVISVDEYLRLGTVPEGSVYKINTGAGLPIGTDSVVMIEDTELVSLNPSSITEEESIKILIDVKHSQHVRQVGSDVRKGELVLRSGSLMGENGGEVAMLVSNGIPEVLVNRRPTIAILSTGDELVDSQDLLASEEGIHQGKVMDCNRPSLMTSIRSQHHADLIDLGIVPCDRSKVLETFRSVLNGPQSSSLGMIICTGSTSMGDTDHLKEVLVEDLEAKIWFGRVSIKPGKPTVFATVLTNDGKEVLVFGLPGNPASAFVTFQVFVRAALRKMEGFGKDEWEVGSVPVEVEDDEIELDEQREEFCRVRIKFDKPTNRLIAISTGFQRSSCSVSLACVNGLLRLPMANHQKKVVKKGEVLQAILVGEIL